MTAALAETTVNYEVGNALGRLQADRPRLARKLIDTTAFARVIEPFLRAIDLYVEERGLSAAERRGLTIDTHLTSTALVLTLNHPVRPGLTDSIQGGSVPGEAMGWMLNRTKRLADLLLLPNVLDAAERLVLKLEEYCRAHCLDERHLTIAPDYPKFMRGLSYVVFEFEAT
jgi:hypothetical protein